MAEFVDLCAQGDLEGVRTALQGGVDVNTKGRGGQTGLMQALRERQTAVVKFLLWQAGVDVNISDRSDSTALHYAVFHDETSEFLAILLSRSDLTILVNHKGVGGQTPLLRAVQYNAVRCVQVLISDNRTDPNIKDNDGDSPLMLAVKWNYVICVKLLLADPRVDLMTRDNYQRSGKEVAR